MSHDLDGRVYIVTGANAGIGRETALELANRGGHVFLASRSEQRTLPVVDEIRNETDNDKVEMLKLDLGSFDSVRECAREFLGRDLPLHVLVNNAGVAGSRGLTESGFELAFGINHLGHFLLTQLLLDKLLQTAPTRVVNVSSEAHYNPSSIDFEAVQKHTASATGLTEYGMSKLANVLFTKELARRYGDQGLHSYALHPGVVATNIWRRVPWPIRPIMKMFMSSEKEGAATTLYCATSPDVADDNGLYYEDCAMKTPNRAAKDPDLAEDLWERSLEWTGLAER